MFKRLRERIAEEATKFPVGQLANTPGKLFPESENRSTESNSTEDLITLSDSSSVVVPHTSPQQFSIGDLEDGSLSEQSTPQRKQNSSGGSDAQNSKEHHSSVFADLSFGQEYRPSKKHSYVPQSDIESEREDPPTLNLDSISKDQLLAIIQSLKARSSKYKNRYSEVVQNYKELREEKVKIETTLIENQDKGLRRIAELREQCQLEQKAKAHLEENLRLLIDERDSQISVLKTQIKLLKESEKSGSTKTLPEDCDSLYSDGGNDDTRSEGDAISMSSDISLLQEKIERMQHQVNQDKKTITAQRDQISLLRKQNENLSQELEDKMKRLNNLEDEQSKLKSEHESVLRILQDRLKELEKQQEENVMSMAETKRNMHEELELKEKQLIKAEEESKLYQVAAEREKELVADLRKQHEERINELLKQLEVTEKTLEDEKQNLLQELGKGKTAAITLMQQQCADKISSIEEEWKAKFEALQSASEKASQEQVENLTNALSITQEKLKQAEQRVEVLDSIIASLEKENSSLKSSVEKLESDVALINAKFENLKVSVSDYESLKKNDRLLKKQEALNSELNAKIEKYVNTEKELQTQCGILSHQLNEKNILVTNLENDKRELIQKLEVYETSQIDHKIKCDALEKEISSLNEVLEKKTGELNSILLDNVEKQKGIDNLQNQLKKVELSEKLACEKLNLSLTETKEFETENAELLLSNRLLSDEIEHLKNSLLFKEKELQSSNESFLKTRNEIVLLNDALATKETLLKQAVISCKQVESLALSLEQQQTCMKQTINNFKNICESVFENSKYIHKNIDCFKTLKPTTDIVCKICSAINKSASCANTIIYPDNITENINHETVLSQVNNDINKLNNDNSDINLSKNDESSNVQNVLSDILDLKKENATLKQELHDCKSFSELQNIEFAKNITILQQSMSNLQEERNNLSLVLQNIENTQKDETNSDIYNEMSSQKKDDRSVNEADYQHNWELRISELNSKVKSEIEALSSQTEIVNKELQNLREQFNSNQDIYAEKLAQLNSKLLFRTEALVNLKEDLDVSVNNAISLKELLEISKKELNEKTEALKSLENKCKALKEKYSKKECELKEAHNSQLIELRNQTRLTIDKLNEEAKLSSTLLKEKEKEFSSKVTSIEQGYQCLISGFQSHIEEALNCKVKLEEFKDVRNSFETKVTNCTSKLDIYSSKITILNSKLNQFISKLQEKDMMIAQQSNVIKDLKEEMKGYAELHKDFNNLQNEFCATSQLLEAANKELQSKNDILKLYETENSNLKSEHEKSLQIINEFSNKNTSEENKLESLLKSTTQELECCKEKYSEISTQFQELQDKHKSALKVVDKLNVLLTKQNLKSDAQIETISELLNNYNNIKSQIDIMSTKFSGVMEKINQLLYEKNFQLQNLKSKFSTVMSQDDLKCQEIFDLKAKLTSSLEYVNSYKVLLEEEKNKLKISDNAIAEWKSKYENAVSEIKDLSLLTQESTKEFQSMIENKEAHLNDLKCKMSNIEEELKRFKLEASEIPFLKKRLDETKEELKNSQKLFEEQVAKLSAIENEKLELKQKYDVAIEDLSNANNLKCKITDMEVKLEKFEIKANEIPVLQKKLGKSEEELKNCQKLLDEQTEKVILTEKENLELKQKYDACVKDLANADNIKCRISNMEVELKKFQIRVGEIPFLQEKLSKTEDELKSCQNFLDLQTEKVSFLESQKLDLEQKYDLALEEVSNLNDVKCKLSDMEVELKKFQSEADKIPVLEENLKKTAEDLKNSQKLLSEEAEKVILVETDKLELQKMYDAVLENLSNANNLKYKLLDMEEELKKYKLKTEEIPILQERLNKTLEDLQSSEKLLDEQTEKVISLENEKYEWKQKYDMAMKDLLEASTAASKEKELKEALALDLEAKNAEWKSMVSYEKLKELEDYQKIELQKYMDQIQNLQAEIDAHKSSLLAREKDLKEKDAEKNNLEAHHEESLKCMKDKLENAEKNCKTQIEEMKLKLNQLEKENLILLSEKQNLLVVQNKFKELKSGESKIQLELKSKNEELKKLQEKLETSNKEQVEKIHTFQESMKDRENMILKLKANLESQSKEHMINVEELHKKIKRLEEEREQLMLQAQERVSATEAKCREDIKSVQEKYDKLLLENGEIEKLRSQISLLNSQHAESLLVTESKLTAANKEISLLKDKLASAENKLTEIEKTKLISESEFSSKLEKLQQENKQLLCNSDHVEKLKAEKEELNVKLKNAVQQVNKIDILENERDHLKIEYEELSKELKQLRTIENESISMREKLKLLEENENTMKKNIKDLTVDNEKLKSDILALKSSFENEKDLLISEKDKLQKQIQHLENCVSDPQNSSVKGYIDSLKKEYETAIKAKDDDMLCKLKQLVKDFSIQMDVKDKDSEQMIAELIEKNQYLEERLQKEHAIEMNALRQDLFEKDCALEEMRDSYEEALQERDAKIKQQELALRSLSPKEKFAVASDSVNNTAEPSDWDDTWVVPDEVADNSSPNHESKACKDHVQQIESLQEELSKCNDEVKELKVLLRLSPPESMDNNNRRDSLQSLPEPTEFEYLKNIIYEYMMGKEPVTLAKVIAAVLRFSDSQTQQVIQREEARHPTK